MKTKIAAAAFLLASTSLGLAADLATKAPYAPAAVWSWTGFYLGGHVGAGWGTAEAAITSTSVPGFLPAGLPLGQTNQSGFLGGGQFGYNWQSGWAVFGVQGDITGMGVKGTAACLGGGAACTAKSDWLATVTGRFGGVVGDRTLVYVKGGAAWMHTNYTFDAAAGLLGGGAFSTSANSTALGWLLGFGAEYAFDQNWSAFIEYNYLEFDKKSMALDFSALLGAPLTVNADIKNKLSIAKIGVNYKFGGPVVARY
jgi:outer membrane immunogenic protein